MKKLSVFALAFASAVIISGCNGLGKMVKNAEKISYEVSPNPLELHGDSVALNISGKYPAKYFNKKASLNTVPVITYSNGQKEYAPYLTIGESVTGSGTKIRYSEGGSFAYNGKVAYEPGMKVSKVELKSTATIKSKSKELPLIKIADATVVTPLLVKADDKAIVGKDDFQKEVPVNYDGNLYYLINSSQFSSSFKIKNLGIENSVETKAVEDYLKMANANGYEIRSVNISAYASPDGEERLNAGLAEKRAETSSKYMMGTFKKLKMDMGTKPEFYNLTSTPEDWVGFKDLMIASDIKDKDLILRILQMHSDSDVREKEMKNMALIFDEVAETIMPKLRRSKVTIVAVKKGRSDEQITALVVSSPDSLSVEEMLYAATLTTDLSAKERIYKTSEQKYGQDWRTSNNLGHIYTMQGKASEAMVQFEKADRLSPNNPIVQNNLGVTARMMGDKQKAAEYYAKAGGAGSEVSENMGIVNILKGNYSAAVANYGATKSFNASLAKLLNGDKEGALSTLEASTDANTAHGNYLKAVIAARMNNMSLMSSSLGKAISMDSSYKKMAKEDMEFLKYFENAEFKAMVN